MMLSPEHFQCITTSITTSITTKIIMRPHVEAPSTVLADVFAEEWLSSSRGFDVGSSLIRRALAVL